MATSRHFTDVKAWQMGHFLALSVYKVTRAFPKDEQFALTNQLRRAATSIPSNIAEGFNRFSLKEKAHFYSISLSSASEVQSQLILAKDLGYINQDEFVNINSSIITAHKLLTALIKSLRA